MIWKIKWDQFIYNDMNISPSVFRLSLIFSVFVILLFNKYKHIIIYDSLWLNNHVFFPLHIIIQYIYFNKLYY